MSLRCLSLKSQLLINAIAPTLLVIVLVTSFVLVDALDELEEQVDTRGYYALQQTILMSEFFFFTGDTEKLRYVADLMLKSDGLATLKFYDDKRHLLIERTHDVTGTISYYEAPIMSQAVDLADFESVTIDVRGTELLGYVEVGISNYRAEQQREHIYWHVFFIAIAGTLLGTFLAVVLSRRIMRSLTTMMKASRDIKRKKFTARSLENGRGELLEFQRSFNEMASSLEKNEQDLQQRINNATQYLNITIAELSKRNKELAVQRQEAIELERSKAISDERTRIMKDMHDGIGGQLVASIAMIEREKETDISRNIASILRECLDDFRLIINSLNVNANELSALLADFKYRHQRKLLLAGLELDWHVDDTIDDIRLQPQQSLHILRILQELFTNIYKHANASTIVFYANKAEDQLELCILDNGCFLGCEQSGGLGVKNMHWRASELGGTLQLSQAQNGGCCACLSIPIS